MESSYDQAQRQAESPSQLRRDPLPADTDASMPSILHNDSSATIKAQSQPQKSVDPRIDIVDAASDTSVATQGTESTPSTLSDRQPSSSTHPEPPDRVFPVRSVVRVDPVARQPSEHALHRNVRSGSLPGVLQRPLASRFATETSAGRQSPSLTETSSSTSVASIPGRVRRTNMSSVEADAERRGSTEPISIIADDVPDEDGDEEPEPPIDTQGSHAGNSIDQESEGQPSSGTYMTTRFKHIITDEGHAVITGRDGKLQRCEDEPIHTPGAVQGFGLLIAIREDQDGQFSVRYASENSRRIIGYSPKELFNLENFLDIFTAEQADNLLDHVDFIRDEDADPAIVGPEVFSLSIRPPRGRSVKLWCAMHIHPAHRELVICEFEIEDDLEFPLRPADEATPDAPEDTLQINPTLEELTESTEILSRPLRVLRSARKRRGEAGVMQVFDIMTQVQEQLASAPNLDHFLKILVGIVKELTGFHRVMIYQFDSTFNGKVVTELVDPTKTRDLYKGLHFPASDIPKQARELYKLNRVRLLYDRDQETARLVCRSTEDLDTPLDMTHSYLRAMSPIHLKYLENMAVRSSMSISINAFGELWGLISCHSYGPHGMRVSFPIRKMCRLVGDTASRNIERLSYASRLQARKLINTAPTDKNPSGYIIASSDDLLKLFDADCGMLSIRGETKILGKIEQSQEALVMLEYLKLRKFTSVVTSQDIRVDFADLHYPPGFSVIAGLLYVPLSVGGSDFMVFFRKGQIREVRWAGNPYEKTIQQGTENYLEPRKSFKVWYETVVGKCREWSEEQVETAAVLCLVYGKFIEVWRQKEAALQNSRLTRLLLANSAHEVRTPLNAIINYLEIALEGTLDQETRENLAKSHSASKSLIYVINDLLDLTKTEEGQGLIKDEVFDLRACIKEATEPFSKDAKRKGIQYEVIENPGLPSHVCGDQRKVRQAVANITANAVEHTSQGSIRVELHAGEVRDNRVQIEIVVQDTGSGMSNEKVDSLFRDLEQVSSELDEPELEEEQGRTKPPETRSLGLGLAVVARIVRNMDGQLRVKSEEGKGSMFVIGLPFGLPSQGSSDQRSKQEPGEALAALADSGASSTTVTPAQDGEITLVKGAKSTSALSQVLSEKKSFDDGKSVSSFQTGTSRESIKSSKSDADRLIDAIQTPLGLGVPEPEAISQQRRSSAGAYYQPSAHPLLARSSSTGSVTPAASVKGASAPALVESTTDHPGPSGTPAPVGVQFVTDSRTPIKPIKVPDDDYHDIPEHPQESASSRVLGEMPAEPSNQVKAKHMEAHAPSQDAVQTTARPAPESAKLNVLVAEDDPINMKLLRKRLEKAGHQVFHTVNGEDCASVYKDKPSAFDVILMDMQMPIVDGLTSTKMIRALEHSDEHAGLSRLAASHGRIPIFAVSASLVECERGDYVGAGFDGWILKPIDFKRLNTLLLGIINDDIREGCLYVPGEWERGGWFGSRMSPEKKHKAAATLPLGTEQSRSTEIGAAENASGEQSS